MKAATSVVLVFAAACGGGGKSDPPVMVIDAPKGQPVDAPPPAVTCLLPQSMGAVTPTQQDFDSGMGMNETSPSLFSVVADLNQDPMPDLLVIELYKNYGAFKSGYPTAPMNINLTGEELDYSTCGACVLAYTDLTQDGATGDPYMASGGTMNLMAVGPNKVKGTLENIQLTHVTIDQDTFASTPHQDGCKSTLGSIAFEASPSMNLVTGKTELRIDLKGRNIVRRSK